MNDTIKAVAEAIEAEALAMGKENFSPDAARPKTERFAKAAIEAMQIREMTVEEMQSVILQSWEAQKENLSPLTRWLAEDAIKSLAKLGTIRIVGDV